MGGSSMSRWRKVLIVASSVLAGALVVPPGLAAAKDAVQSVLIANTPDQPVPVAGSVAVTGTVGVNGTVPVDGTVSVRDSREPFETRVDLPLGAGTPFDTFSFDVPAGKRLVVEFVSARVALPSGQTPLLSANASNGATGFAIPLALQGVGNGNGFWAGAMPAVDFASAGAYFIGIERQNPAGGALSGTASGFVYLSGYLLPA